MARSTLSFEIPERFKSCVICGEPMKPLYPEDYMDNTYICSNSDCLHNERFIRKYLI